MTPVGWQRASCASPCTAALSAALPPATAQRCARLRALRWRAASGRGETDRAVTSRSTLSPPSPRSVSTAAISAASSPAPRRCESTIMRASRGGSASARRLLAFVGDAAIGIERAEFAQQAPRFLQRRRRRRIEKRQRRGIADAPLREIEHQRRQIGAEDFRLRIGRERGGLRLVPQPVADAGLGAAGAAAALVDRGARGAHGLQPRQADVGLVARHPRHAGIDDDAHALDGQRGLGDRGRQHDLALALRRRRDGAVLHARHRARRTAARFRSTASWTRSPRKFWVRRISAAPGRNASTEPGSARNAVAIASAICRSSGASGLAAEIARLDRKGAALACDHRRLAEQFCDPRAVERRRHHEDAQILAQAGLRVARQRQPQIGIERAFVKFVEQHGGDAVQFGIVEDLPREDAFGDDLDPRRARHFRAEADAIADGLADPLAERLRHALGAGARRDPARLQHDDLLALRPRAHRAAPAAPAWSCRRRAAPPARRRCALASVRASSSSTASIGRGVSKLRGKIVSFRHHPRRRVIQ